MNSALKRSLLPSIPNRPSLYSNRLKAVFLYVPYNTGDSTLVEGYVQAGPAYEVHLVQGRILVPENLWIPRTLSEAQSLYVQPNVMIGAVV